MNHPLVLVGSGRLAFQIADIIRQIKLYDDYDFYSYCRHAALSVNTPFQRILDLPNSFSYVVAVGNPSQRMEEVMMINNLNSNSTPLNIIASSYVSSNASIPNNSGIIALPSSIIISEIQRQNGAIDLYELARRAEGVLPVEKKRALVLAAS